MLLFYFGKVILVAVILAILPDLLIPGPVTGWSAAKGYSTSTCSHERIASST
jgi:hypothetical protein